jgi:hypothetical protein
MSEGQGRNPGENRAEVRTIQEDAVRGEQRSGAIARQKRVRNTHRASRGRGTNNTREAGPCGWFLCALRDARLVGLGFL